MATASRMITGNGTPPCLFIIRMKTTIRTEGMTMRAMTKIDV